MGPPVQAVSQKVEKGSPNYWAPAELFSGQVLTQTFKSLCLNPMVHVVAQILDPLVKMFP